MPTYTCTQTFDLDLDEDGFYPVTVTVEYRDNGEDEPHDFRIDEVTLPSGDPTNTLKQPIEQAILPYLLARSVEHILGHDDARDRAFRNAEAFAHESARDFAADARMYRTRGDR